MQSVQIVIISTIIVFAFVGVMASLGLAKVKHIFLSGILGT